MSNQDNTPDNTPHRGYPFLILFLALAVVIGLQFVPWSDITGGRISDFNIFSDLLPQAKQDTTVHATDNLDPELLAALADTVTAEKATTTTTDSLLCDTLAPVEAREARVNGEMTIEDYTPDEAGLRHFKSAIANRSNRPVRIAVIGDSYIEGDIFTQDIRRELQQQYGGKGVGYMPAFSQTAGFRRSVIHSASDWTEHDIRKSTKKKFGLAGEYFTGENGSKITYKGTKREPSLASWDNSRLIFIAPAAGTLTITTDAGATDFAVTAAPDSVQCIEVRGNTTSLKISSTVPGLIVLGAWLEGSEGIVLDCMSLRGDSGVTHKRVSTEITSGMRPYVDYDLIIVEYGINALSAEQTDYTAYGKLMTDVVRHLQKCYPNADIILMGIGDRGVKRGGEVHSIPTAEAMIMAQRNAARNAGCLFWDTREAMGGPDAIVDWREQKLVNADYIHLNSAGGRKLASELVKSINKALDE